MMKPLIVLTAVASLLLIADQSNAQQASFNGNVRVGTFGDISQGKLSARTRAFFGLRLGPGGLFGDAEVFGDFSQPRQFVFPLPNFSGAGLDFNGVTFQEYLQLVANSYEVADINDYLFRFSFLNEISAASPGFIPSQDQIIQVHQNDFVAGGGFLPLPPDFITPDPILPTPLVPPTDPGDDGVPLPDPLPGGPIVPTSASSSLSAPALSVSTVPEPASLALMSMGVGLMLRRSRRR
jgi:PEP-CTERM motif